MCKNSIKYIIRKKEEDKKFKKIKKQKKTKNKKEYVNELYGCSAARAENGLCT